ncbi:MAG TPA: hypothetical protein VLL97_12780 [Acidobacteriota bacterium]|nr:hypothetical protein [Acidobacteriota bacterium]
MPPVATMIMIILSIWWVWQAFFLAAGGQAVEKENIVLDRSAWFAFVARDYIFTIELAEPGMPILNFVSMTDGPARLPAGNIQLALENRKAAVSLFAVETGQSGQAVLLASLTIHPRSSFGVRLEGDFGKERELHGAAIRLENEVFHLAPLTKPDFEQLVTKVNRLNLDSPDFRDDWKLLRLEPTGKRSQSRK